MKSTLFGVLAFSVAVAGNLHAAATITIVNNDGPGEGFNDPAARAPIGNNPGTTLGQQRLNAFNHVASLWGQWITSTVPIAIRAQFDPQTCGAGGAVLGSAGTININRDDPSFPFAATWFHAALANKLAGVDLVPANPEINATFNSALDTGCLPGTTGWYYGLDGAAPVGTTDLVPVLMHEMAHGLGFSTFVNTGTGANNGGFTDIFSRHAFDLDANLFWNQMNDAQRQASAINSRKLVWDGPSVTGNIAFLAFGTPELAITAPAPLAGLYDIGAASFGPTYPAAPGGLPGNVVLAVDGTAPTSDACEPITNTAAMAGNICLVDRGTCGFAIKVKACQVAGAIGALVADNVAGTPPPGMTGVDPTITIPSGRITLTLGNSIKAALPGVAVRLQADMTQRAGAEPTNTKVFLNAPNPLVPGSSVSHWDPITFPNTLMEPAINADLQYRPDLTENQFEDIGWGPVTPAVLKEFKIE
ncbi:MAG: PA domain-containing protein [Vicinamibacteria bacterium]